MQTGTDRRQRHAAFPGLVLLVVLLLVGCGSTLGQDSENPFMNVTPADVEALAVGRDEKDVLAESCSGFTLDRAQVVAFLRAATVVSDRDLHDRFELDPCWVDLIVTANVRYEVRVRIGGVASARAGERQPFWLVGELDA